ncbi:Saposin B-type domain-containing protein [Trichostrongylus colubriformis]|uniref:Saposin B-type domain-containing protein n=1 Tax=Trichostrongylus colubriformis TaxID=6319 RepID=A0AAN8FNA7_TRICO
MIALRIVFVLSLAFVSLKAFSSETKCNTCKVLMTNVKEKLPSLSKTSTLLLEQTMRSVCQKYVTIQPFEEICEYVEHKLLDALYMWLAKKEGEIDPELDCQYMRFCPRSKGFEIFLRLLKVPDVSLHQ